MKQVATILIEQEDGGTEKHTREFGGYKRDLRWLIAWLQRYEVELGVMESTGIYWKSLYAHLERAGIETWVVNAHRIKHAPGRKTDMGDPHWLAEPGRFGLVRPSFIPPSDLRELRLISRYREKLSGILAGQKNRLHKLLDDAGVKLGAVVSDINGVSARAMIQGLIDGRRPKELIDLAKRRLKGERAELLLSLDVVIRRGHKKTIVALAHKLIRTIYVLLTHRVPYRDSGFDYEAAAVAENSPRWIRALKQFGYWPNLSPQTA